MSALITQLITDEPTILVFSDEQPVADRLVMELRRSGTNSVASSLAAGLSRTEQNAQLLADAYKIICCIKPAACSELQTGALIKLLSAHQGKATVILLLDTAVQFSVHEPYSLTEWRIQSDAQEKNVILLSKTLDRTRIIFCQDVCSEGTAGQLPAWQSVCSDPIELLDPQISLAPQEVEQLVHVLVQQVLLPLPQPSLLIRGAAMRFGDLLRGVLQTLQVESLRTMAIRTVRGVPRPILPFSTQEIVLAQSSQFLSTLSGWLAKLIPSLPQPQHVQQKNASPVLAEHLQRIELEPVVVTQSSIEPPIVQQPKLSVPNKAQSIHRVKKTSSLVQKPEVDVSAELQKIFTPTRVTETVERVVKIARTEKTTTVKGRRKRVLFSGGMIAILLGLTLFALAGAYATSVAALKSSVESVLSQPDLLLLTPAKSESAVSVNTQFPSTSLAKIVGLQTAFYGGLFESSLTARAQQYVEVATLLPQAAAELQTTQKATKSLYSFVMGNELGDVDQLSNQLTTAAQNSYEQLSKLQALLKTVDLKSSATMLADTGLAQQASNTQAPFEQILAKIRKTLVIQQQLHAILPQMLGAPTKRTYAVVFQNSQELRPTGGFIQAIGLVTFANGTLVNTEVVSSYQLDQQLMGLVQPPAEVQRYLGEKQWFLRDSNWDPHFPSTASKIAWFIDRTKSVRVDGVVAINLESMQGLLAAMGPVEIPEYNEVITNKNLLERMEFHSEVMLAPDTTQRDYSTVLLEKILHNATTLPDQAVLQLLSALQDGLTQQQVAIALFEESEGELLENLGWSGGIVRPTCPAQLAQSTCLVDYIYPVEANVGVNKANAYIARSVTHDVYLEASAAAHTHVLRLENTARSNSWPKGTYKNYQRTYVPAEAQDVSVSINGDKVLKDQLNVYIEQGLTVVGFEVSVPIQQQVEVVVTYRVPQETSSGFSYALFVQKQPGIGEVPTAIRVHSPTGMQPTRIAPAATVSGGVIEFTLRQKEHAFVGVEFK